MSTLDILGNTSEQADSIRLMLKVRGMKDGRFIDADPLIILKADNHQGSDSSMRRGGPAPNASDVGTDTNPDVPKPDAMRPASCSTNGLTNKWRWTMSWLDDSYRIVGKGDVRDSDFILNGESFYCPQCGRRLKAATGTVKGSEEKRYRFKCVDRMHYRTQWHESYQAALMEMIKTFEKGENA